MALVERIEKPSSRIIYTLWDLVKKPTEFLASFGDKLAETGRQRYVVDRVAGLHDFWRELARSPVQEESQSLLKRLFPDVAEPAVWNMASHAAEAFNMLMKTNAQDGSSPSQQAPSAS